MVLWLGLLSAIILMVMMAWFFRRALPDLENPKYVMEKPPLPRDLAKVADRVDLWREEGRLSREEHERLMHLVMEDARRKNKKV